MGAEELAERTGTDARYVREWLSNQAAGGFGQSLVLDLLFDAGFGLAGALMLIGHATYLSG